MDPTHDLAAKLAVPPTPLEMAQLATAANSHDHSLNAAGMMILRRLMFAYERRTRPVRPAGEVGEALARWKLHKATDMRYLPLANPYAIVAFHELCGFRWDLTMMDEDKELLAAAFAAQFEGESA